MRTRFWLPITLTTLAVLAISISVVRADATLDDLIQRRNNLRQAHRAELESLVELQLDQVTRLQAQRLTDLAKLTARQQELSQQTSPTDAEKQDRLSRAKAYAALVSARLKAANVRLLDLSVLIQQRVTQSGDQTTTSQLNQQLAKLVPQQEQLDTLVSQTSQLLTDISDPKTSDHNAAAMAAATKVDACLKLMTSLQQSLQSIVNSLPNG